MTNEKARLKLANEINSFSGECIRSVISDRTVEKLSSKWKGPSGVLNLEIEKGKILIVGRYSKRDPLKLTGSIDGPVPESLVIRYSGRLQGRTSDGKITLIEPDRPSKALVRKNASILIFKNMKEIGVWMTPRNFSGALHKLKRHDSKQM